MQKIDIDDPKLYDYFKAHLEDKWSISCFNKYLRPKHREIFCHIKKHDDRFKELCEKYRQFKACRMRIIW